MTKFKLDKCLKENGWNRDQIIRIDVSDGRTYKRGGKGFAGQIGCLNSGRMAFRGVMIGFTMSHFMTHSHKISIWGKNKIYEIYRKIA